MEDDQRSGWDFECFGVVQMRPGRAVERVEPAAAILDEKARADRAAVPAAMDPQAAVGTVGIFEREPQRR